MLCYRPKPQRTAMSELETYGSGPFGATTKFVRRPVWICDRETGRFVWANGEALSFWAAQSLAHLQSRALPDDHPAWRQISEAFAKQDQPLRLTLSFPERGEELCYQTLCRLGCLKERPAVVVEIISTLKQQTSIEAPDHSDKPALNGAVQDQPSSVLFPEAHTPPSPPEALQDLAALIKQARDDDNAGLATDSPDTKPAEIDDAPDAASVLDHLSLDLTALKGVGDDDEIETLFSACPQPVALVYLHRILHANAAFVSAFGYGDITSLGNDGTDWILPQSRDKLRPFYEQGRQEPLVLNDIRLCSGRQLKRSVIAIPVRLVKFDRVFLLLTFVEAFDGALETAFPNQSSLEARSLLSFIGHEVRNPLNIIQGFAQLLAREEFGPLGNEKYKDYAQDILQSSDLALSLINDFLDLNKLKSGQWDIDLVPLEVNEIVRGQVHLVREMAAQKGVKLRSSLEENLPPVLADERGLVQILLNLLSNALKFTPRGGVVHVETEQDSEGQVVLRVKDTGPGMSAADLQKALHPFQQTEQGAMLTGTGLGLTIVQELARISGFHFSLQSELGAGTEVVLQLPAHI